MVPEVLVGLNCRSGRLYVDGTVGEGGHATAILHRTTPDGQLWGLDRDPAALQAAAARLAHYTSRFRLFHRPYSELGDLLKEAGVSGVAGIMVDLGLSLFQLQQSGRGFSFMQDEPLDMRFDPEDPGPTAAEILNTASESELEQIFREFGEEPRSRRLARLIVQIRRQSPFETTGQLVRAAYQALGQASRHHRIHPATRAFQALRIAVNRELELLDQFLVQVPDWLETGGRLVVISYHSLEDRVVKHQMQAWHRSGVMQMLTRKPLSPALDEIHRNPRARSAKLRVAERR
jgi:16S rRNA (cytosine1402-N4)-methyltransferase